MLVIFPDAFWIIMKKYLIGAEHFQIPHFFNFQLFTYACNPTINRHSDYAFSQCLLSQSSNKIYLTTYYERPRKKSEIIFSSIKWFAYWFSTHTEAKSRQTADDCGHCKYWETPHHSEIQAADHKHLQTGNETGLLPHNVLVYVLNVWHLFVAVPPMEVTVEKEKVVGFVLGGISILGSWCYSTECLKIKKILHGFPPL